MKKQPRVFLAHATEDKDAVRQLYAQLTSRSFKPWLDEIDLIPGQNWQVEILKAIRSSDVFVACLSKKSVEKFGFVQKEFRIALDVYAERPPGSIYLIPVKFDDCEVPDLRIPHLGIALRDIHYVDVWRKGGFEHLVKTIEYTVTGQEYEFATNRSKTFPLSDTTDHEALPELPTPSELDNTYKHKIIFVPQRKVTRATVEAVLAINPELEKLKEVSDEAERKEDVGEISKRLSEIRRRVIQQLKNFGLDKDAELFAGITADPQIARRKGSMQAQIRSEAGRCLRYLDNLKKTPDERDLGRTGDL